jgi:hypothetical protein
MPNIDAPRTQVPTRIRNPNHPCVVFDQKYHPLQPRTNNPEVTATRVRLDVVEPAWLKEVAPDSCLTYEDLWRMFGYASKSGISDAVLAGRFPKPDMHRKGNNKAFWKVSTIRKEFRRRRILASQQ